MKIMTFNLWNQNEFHERIESVLETVKKADPDIIGFQEALLMWMDIFEERLPEYIGIGEGRDGGHEGEYNPIFVKKDKFEILASGTRWMSETPDVVSKHPLCWCPRIFSYVMLRDRKSGKVFWHLNTHLDNARADVRAYQAKNIISYANTISSPVNITGDFNLTEEDENDTYKVINGDRFGDSKHLAGQKYDIPTYHGDDGSCKIDYLFTDKSAFKVINYRVIDEKSCGRYPSDHHPVLVELEFSEEK